MKLQEYIQQKKILKQNKLNELINYLKYFDKGDIINPLNIKEKLNLSDTENQELFSYLSSFGIYKHVYRYYCPKCNHLSMDIYESLDEIDEVNECENCNCDLPEKNMNTLQYILR